jgi:hypothetical protein
MSDIPVGLCQCGCGQQTKVSAYTSRTRGYLKGVPLKYVSGHDGRTRTAKGYKELDRNGDRTYEHIAVAERALGKPLPSGAQVHHVNGNPRDNRPANLVVCQDMAYHKLLHLRQRALRECGIAEWRRCKICKAYDSPANLEIHPKAGACHFDCKSDRDRQRRIWTAAKAGRPTPGRRKRSRGKCKAQGQFKLEKAA